MHPGEASLLSRGTDAVALGVRKDSAVPGGQIQGGRPRDTWVFSHNSVQFKLFIGLSVRPLGG